MPPFGCDLVLGLGLGLGVAPFSHPTNIARSSVLFEASIQVVFDSTFDLKITYKHDN